MYTELGRGGNQSINHTGSSQSTLAVTQTETKGSTCFLVSWKKREKKKVTDDLHLWLHERGSFSLVILGSMIHVYIVF